MVGTSCVTDVAIRLSESYAFALSTSIFSGPSWNCLLLVLLPIMAPETMLAVLAAQRCQKPISHT
jgi:hypothetical protein